METLESGQCGLCSHFGGDHAESPLLVHLPDTKQAHLAMLDECCHLRHAARPLRVSPISGGDGFIPAAAA